MAKLIVLGSGQDAGIPFSGCSCKTCVRAKKSNKFQRLAPSIALKINDQIFIVDASPDINLQLRSIKLQKLKGVFITHAHYGHISGLWEFGLEALDAKGMIVYCTKKMKRFLEQNYPSSLLVKRKNIILKNLVLGKWTKLGDLNVKPIIVPHRNEVADTVAYIFKAKKKIFYMPDVDYLTPQVIKEIKSCDISLIDGTFFTKTEIPDYDYVPHPTIVNTMDLLKGIKKRIIFTHINHSNQINISQKAKKNVLDRGFEIAFDSMNINF